MTPQKINDSTWIVTVMKNGVNEEMTIQLPEDAISQVGWQPDDVIEWFGNTDGTYTLRKKDVV